MNDEVSPFGTSTPTYQGEEELGFVSGGMDESTSDHTDYTSEASRRSNEEEAAYLATSLARNEHRAVIRTKWIVISVLSIGAVVLGAAAYLSLSSNERHEFETQLDVHASEIEDLLHQRTENMANTLGNFATSISTFAQATNATWPLVSLPHFKQRAADVNKVIQSDLMGFSPLVEEADRRAWRDYVLKDESNRNLQEQTLWPYLPVWQLYPTNDPPLINQNLRSIPAMDALFQRVVQTRQPLFASQAPDELSRYVDDTNNVQQESSLLIHPVFDLGDNTKEIVQGDIVGMVFALTPWHTYLQHLLPPSETANGIVVVIQQSCIADSAFTYQINGQEAVFLGEEDLHDTLYSEFQKSFPFHPLGKTNETFHSSSNETTSCDYRVNIYPSREFEMSIRTDEPILFSVVIVVVFLITAMVFSIYDIFVQRRQKVVLKTAMRTNAVVTAMFPKNVRERILRDIEAKATQQPDFVEEHNNSIYKKKKKLLDTRGLMPQKSKIKKFLADKDKSDKEHNEYAMLSEEHLENTPPIADLFPHATVLFADIVGFTAWSSVREPTQVFTLLETLYTNFDKIAKRRRIFKVETIGDCYVAVAGLPEPRKDHAPAMARFAKDLLCAINDLTKRLEVKLGPDTGDLSMRVGIHSGPVTAGVLRGDNCRFQLFGDTVNTTARIESNGERGKIHVSSSTAEYLKKAGKGNWLTPRSDKVLAKGKGLLDTYWLEMRQSSNMSMSSGSEEFTGDSESVVPVSEQMDFLSTREMYGSVHDQLETTPRVKRLVNWNVEVLSNLLKDIIARRVAHKMHQDETNDPRVPGFTSRDEIEQLEEALLDRGNTAFEEVQEIITLPAFIAETSDLEAKIKKTITLDPLVVKQLHTFVTLVSTMYKDVPFHNFEHASHVTQSVVKMMSRIVAPDEVLSQDTNERQKLSDMHDHTFGITSSPLTRFAVVLSALVHDMAHEGVPNATLIEENSPLARLYKNQSVAEQNSIDLAWNLLMDPAFKDLRRVIYTKEVNLRRLRQLMVATVLATDIVDKDLKQQRNARWEKAFQSGKLEAQEGAKEDAKEDADRKATIVIEHLIQASDIAHTMQHWHIYRKWNERFFEENVRAYKEGRSAKNPVEFWYQGELGFFDFYIIPLAKKLKECGVFGVSCDEYLSYAEKNRKEWEVRGEDIVAEMFAKYFPEKSLRDPKEHFVCPSQA